MPQLCPHCGAEQPAVRVAFCPACRNDVDEPPVNPQTGLAERETLDLNVWYATETLFYSWGKKSRSVARGVFVILSEGIQFVDRQGWGFEMRRINAVRWMFPWTTCVGLAIPVVLFFLLLIFVAATGGPIWGCLTVSMSALVIGILAALSSPEMCWVRVDYLDERNQPYRAYFTVGSIMDRWTGGGWRLYALLKQLATEKRAIVNPTDHSTEAGATSDRPPDTRIFGA